MNSNLHKWLQEFNDKYCFSTIALETTNKSTGECFRSGDKFHEVRLYCRELKQTFGAKNESFESRLPSVSRAISEMTVKMDACQDILEKQKLVNVLLLLLNLYILYTFYKYSAAINCSWALIIFRQCFCYFSSFGFY